MPVNYDDRVDEKHLCFPWGWKAHDRNVQWSLSEASFYTHEFIREKYSGSITVHFQDGKLKKVVPAPSLDSALARERMLQREEELLK